MEDKWTHQELDLTTTDPKTSNLECEMYPDGEMFIQEPFGENTVWLNEEQVHKLYTQLHQIFHPKE